MYINHKYGDFMSRLSKVFYVLFFLLLFCRPESSFSLDRKDIRFYLSFEQGIQPEISIGKTDISFEKGSGKALTFEERGKKGRAIIISSNLSIRYKNNHLFSTREGTISLWVRPIDWQAKDWSSHPFVTLYSDIYNITLYKYWPGSTMVHISGNDVRSNIGQHKRWDMWEKNQWTHLAFSFKPGEQSFYINGHLLEQRNSELLEPEFSKTGSLIVRSGNTTQAVDEILTFSRALTEEEIKALYNSTTIESTFVSIPTLKCPNIGEKLVASCEWTNAASVSGWVDSTLGILNADKSTVAVGHDNKAVHILFKYPVSTKFRDNRAVYAGSPLMTSVKDRDGEISYDDYFGVYLSPPGSENIFFFGINGRNVKRDEKNFESSWNGIWEAQQSLDDYFWTVELSIPYSIFGENNDGLRQNWGINFVHGSRQLEFSDSIWFYKTGPLIPLAQIKFSQSKNFVQLAKLGNPHRGIISLKAVVASDKGFRGSSVLYVKKNGIIILEPQREQFVIGAGERRNLSSSLFITEPLYGQLFYQVKDSKGQIILDYVIPFVYSQQMDIEAHYLPTSQILKAVIDIGSSSYLMNTKEIFVKLISLSSGQELKSTKISQTQSIKNTIEIDCQDIPIGKYKIQAEIKTKDSTITLVDYFQKDPSPEWLGNKIGYIDSVPEPWIPLSLSGNNVSMWGRNYRFGAAGLPEQITIFDEDFLASPATLAVTASGRTWHVSNANLKITEAKDTKISFTSSSTLGPLDMQANAWIEFDGFMFNTIKLSSAVPVEIEQITIEVPIKKKYAQLWSPHEYIPKLAGVLPKKRYTAPPKDAIRIGTEEHGVQFSHLNAWKQDLIPGDTEYQVKYTYLKKPVMLNGSLDVTIGIQALPVKPRSSLYRRFRAQDALWTSNKGQEPFWFSPIFTAGWNRHWNYLNFWNHEVFEEEFIQKRKALIAEQWKKDKRTFVMYLNIKMFDANTPEFRKYRYEWVGDNAPYVPPDPEKRDEVVRTRINSYTPSFLDFYMWYLNKTVRYLSDDGKIPIHCYIDVTTPNRQYMKRLFGVMKSVNPLNQIFVHMSGNNQMYAWSFADWLAEGEEMTSHYRRRSRLDPTLPKNYTKLLDLPKIRARYQPFAFGDKLFLSQFRDWNVPSMMHLWGLLSVHDGTTWRAGGPGYFREALNEFGWDDHMKFIPYWRSDTGIQVLCDTKPVVASGWTKGKSNLLVMVLNESEQSGSCQLVVDYKKFGFNHDQVQYKDYGFAGLTYIEQQATKNGMLVHSESFDFKIRSHSYKLLRFHE
jgi:hypothetical protein